MDFGKVESENLDQIDFTLVPDPAGTKRVLAANTIKPPHVLVGCAKWGRKDWIGKIYPPKTKEADFLNHYARHFNCIELNATFYRLPTENQTKAWASKVTDGFKFAPKFSQEITHFKRLKGAEESTDRFLKGLQGMGDHLGPLFLQLPPNFPPKNFDVLKAYIESLPKDINLFVELRHPDWFTPEWFDKTFDMFEQLGVGSIITDASGRRDCVHMRLTTPEAFIRFVGNGLHPTDYKRCDDWVQRIKLWMEQGAKAIYFFMHQHEELHSPELSKYVIEQLNKYCGTEIHLPEFISPDSIPEPKKLKKSEPAPNAKIAAGTTKPKAKAAVKANVTSAVKSRKAKK